MGEVGNRLMRQARQWCVGLFDGKGMGMDKESLDATVNRFRLHGFGHEQAIMMAEAIDRKSVV